ncbi:hypothetical protein [Peribacillus simplex]|uniref:hypothetical protein n=1 Tax=Peribacillus simplex TaxID=1478 RepID=UPI003D2A1316
MFSECRCLFPVVLEGYFLLGILIVIPYSWALILALLTAILLDGLVRKIGKTTKLHRLWAVLISFVLYVGGLLSITYFSFSVLIKKIIVYSEEFPGFIREMYLTAILPVIRQWERYSQTFLSNLNVHRTNDGKGSQGSRGVHRGLCSGYGSVHYTYSGVFH